MGVDVRIGGDTSGIDQAMAKVSNSFDQLSARAGNAKGFHKLEKQLGGLGGLISHAQDPLQALIMGGEKLAGIMRIAFGPIGIAIFLGEKLREVLEGAAAGAEKMVDAVGASFDVTAGTSIDELKGKVDSLKKATEEFAKGNFIEKALGAGAMQIAKERLIELQQEIDKRSASMTRAQTKSQSSDYHTKAEGEVELINQEYREKIAKANKAGEVENAKALEEQKQQKIAEVKKKYLDEWGKEIEERVKKENTALTEQAHKEAQEKAEIDKEHERQREIRRNEAEKRATAEQKRRMIEEDIAADKQAQKVGTRVEVEKAKTKEAEDQARLSEFDAEQEKKKVTLAERLKELNEKKKALNERMGSEKASMGGMFAESKMFNGAVSSMRHLGFGGRMGSSNHQDTLHKMDEGNKKLDNITTELKKLNDKSAEAL